MIKITRDNIRIDENFEILKDWNPVSMAFYAETFFDPWKKLNVVLSACGDTLDAWIDMNLLYNPIENYLYVEFTVNASRDSWYEYTPTPAERKVIISMLEECCKKETGMTCSEWLQKELKEE